MAETDSEIAVLDVIPENTRRSRPPTLTERFGITDDRTGLKMKDTADKTGAVIAVGGLLIGFLIWVKASDIFGFLLGFVIAGGGIFLSQVLVLALHSVADMFTLSIEQTKILRRMEEQKKQEKPGTDKEEMIKLIEADRPADQGQAENAQAVATTEADDPALEKAREEEAKTRELIRKKSKQPLTGVIDARMRRVAHFTERSEYGIICPVCNRKQDSEKNNCYFCDCKFLYDYDPPNRDEELLERLRHLS